MEVELTPLVRFNPQHASLIAGILAKIARLLREAGYFPVVAHLLQLLSELAAAVALAYSLYWTVRRIIVLLEEIRMMSGLEWLTPAIARILSFLPLRLVCDFAFLPRSIESVILSAVIWLAQGRPVAYDAAYRGRMTIRLSHVLFFSLSLRMTYVLCFLHCNM
jgi:hypothetical protein